MFRILDAIDCGVHWINSIVEIVFEFVKIQFTETNPKLGKIRKPCWIMYSKDRFLEWKGRILDSSFVLKAAIEGESLISRSSLFHSDKQ